MREHKQRGARYEDKLHSEDESIDCGNDEAEGNAASIMRECRRQNPTDWESRVVALLSLPSPLVSSPSFVQQLIRTSRMQLDTSALGGNEVDFLYPD